jgi:hypothetical protein
MAGDESCDSGSTARRMSSMSIMRIYRMRLSVFTKEAPMPFPHTLSQPACRRVFAVACELVQRSRRIRHEARSQAKIIQATAVRASHNPRRGADRTWSVPAQSSSWPE